MTDNPDQQSRNFTDKFSFIRDEESMTIKYVCECCGNEEEITQKMPSENNEKKAINYQQMFLEMQHKIRDSYTICEYCYRLICKKCYENKEILCSDCPHCTSASTS